MPFGGVQAEGRTLAYTEVTSSLTTTLQAPTYKTDGGWEATLVHEGGPLEVEAWTSINPSNNTAARGLIMRLVRVDTSTTLGQIGHTAASTLSGAAGESYGPLRVKRRLTLAAGTYTFRVEFTGTGGASTVSFGATADMPLCIQVKRG